MVGWKKKEKIKRKCGKNDNLAALTMRYYLQVFSVIMRYYLQLFSVTLWRIIRSKDEPRLLQSEGGPCLKVSVGYSNAFFYSVGYSNAFFYSLFNS